MNSSGILRNIKQSVQTSAKLGHLWWFEGARAKALTGLEDLRKCRTGKIYLGRGREVSLCTSDRREIQLVSICKHELLSDLSLHGCGLHHLYPNSSSWQWLGKKLKAQGPPLRGLGSRQPSGPSSGSPGSTACPGLPTTVHTRSLAGHACPHPPPPHHLPSRLLRIWGWLQLWHPSEATHHGLGGVPPVPTLTSGI